MGDVDEAKSSSIARFLTQPQENFRETGDIFISTCLAKVYKEHKKSLSDEVDMQIEIESVKKCVGCNANSELSSHRICCNCGETLKTSTAK